jgi:predicted phage terminase large subunit-like protein
MPRKSRRDLLIERLLAAETAAGALIPFAKFVMPDPNDVDDVAKSQYQDALHHRAIAAALEEVEKGNYQRIIINCPPRHGKTELASKKFLAWYSGRNPSHHAIFGTYNEIYAKDVGRAVRDIIQSPYFAQVFPDYSLKDGSAAADRLETHQGGILAFVGRGGTTTGRGGHILIIDDPIKNQAEARSPAIRNELWDWFTKVVKTRMMTQDARILIIQTRWHEDDLVGRLTDPTSDFYDPVEAREWKIIDLPALALDDDPLGRKPGAALWPERFSEKFLEDQRRGDPKGFAALYQGRPTVDGGTFFQEKWLRTYKPHELPKNLRFYVASDHAVSTVQDRDKTCMIPVGIDQDDNIFILQDVWWRTAPADVVVDAMLGLMQTHKPLFWWAERSHITKSIGPFLRKRMSEDGIHCAIAEIVPVADKQTRAQSIQGRMAMGKVFFPERAPWWPAARDQLLKFPGAAHDDFVDALAYVGLGLTMQSPASMRRVKSPVAEKTFGAMLADSNRRKRDAAMAKQSGGW